MRDQTIKALKILRGSKALALDQEAFSEILADLRKYGDAELWARSGRQPKSAKPVDETLIAVKQALVKFKAPLAVKAQRLTAYLLPQREGPEPKGMPAALKILRGYMDEQEIVLGAKEFMRKQLAEVGTDVPL